MIDKPYWYKLLNHFENKHYFQNGLTIPFIIGSKTIIEPNNEIDTVEELFNQVKESDYTLSVLKCDMIGEFVFSIAGVDDQDTYGGVENLVIIDDSFNEMKTIEEISLFLSNRYTTIINAGDYSRIDGDWTSFSVSDEERIGEIV